MSSSRIITEALREDTLSQNTWTHVPEGWGLGYNSPTTRHRKVLQTQLAIDTRSHSLLRILICEFWQATRYVVLAYLPPLGEGEDRIRLMLLSGNGMTPNSANFPSGMEGQITHYPRVQGDTTPQMCNKRQTRHTHSFSHSLHTQRRDIAYKV